MIRATAGWDKARNCIKISKEITGVHPRPLDGIYLWYPRFDAPGVLKADKTTPIGSVQLGELPLTNNGLVFAILVRECAGRMLKPEGFVPNLNDELLSLAGHELLALVFLHLAVYSLRPRVQCLKLAAAHYGSTGVLHSLNKMHAAYKGDDQAELDKAHACLLNDVRAVIRKITRKPNKLIPVDHIPESRLHNTILSPANLRNNVNIRLPRRPGTLVAFPNIQRDGQVFTAFGEDLEAVMQQLIEERPDLKASGALANPRVFEGFATGFMPAEYLPKDEEQLKESNG